MQDICVASTFDLRQTFIVWVGWVPSIGFLLPTIFDWYCLIFKVTSYYTYTYIFEDDIR